MSKDSKRALVPKMRFPEFRKDGTWEFVGGDKLFDPRSNKNHNGDLPILAITQEHGAIPRDLIDYTVIATDKSIQSYKIVEPGDFIISLRSFQGGIEYSNYKGICSPAYIILRKKSGIESHFYRHYFKSSRFIRDLNKDIEGIRDGKMVSYDQFSKIQIPYPKIEEQRKIADCLSSLDDLISAQNEKITALKTYKKGLLQQLFPQEGETVPRLRFPEFRKDGEWKKYSINDLIEKGVLFPPQDGNHGEIHPKAEDYVQTGIPFIMANNVRNGRIDFTTCNYITRAQADSLRKGFSKEGDVLLTHKGTVGEVAIVPKSEFPYVMLTPQVTYYRVKDKTQLHNCFLATAFISPAHQKSLQIVSGGGTRAYIGITEQSKLMINIPPRLKEQEKIAACVSVINEVISSNIDWLEYLKDHKKGLLQQLFPSLAEGADE